MFPTENFIMLELKNFTLVILTTWRKCRSCPANMTISAALDKTNSNVVGFVSLKLQILELHIECVIKWQNKALLSQGWLKILLRDICYFFLGFLVGELISKVYP